ncbi:unnamed protein product [marine sediment metagenome]|uniref:Uncharacterized protein n=1 Tax=marine sediment metagenome TaxID=412755 RepID=X1RRC1_9ZZZZ
MVQRPTKGRPVYRLLNIKNPRFYNSGSQSNSYKKTVHVLKVIEETIPFMFTNDTLSRHVGTGGD